jgi:hypothetical protein
MHDYPRFTRGEKYSHTAGYDISKLMSNFRSLRFEVSHRVISIPSLHPAGELFSQPPHRALLQSASHERSKIVP